MRIKTDENLARDAVELLRSAGHDVETILDEHLQGAQDVDVFRACQKEKRILLTLDRGFAQVLRLRPAPNPGLEILELGPDPTLRALMAQVRDFLNAASLQPAEGMLWIVEPGRIRIRLDRE